MNHRAARDPSAGDKMTLQTHQKDLVDGHTGKMTPGVHARHPVWKAFRFEDAGCVLLHVPSSHVVEVTEDVYRHVTGEHVDPDFEAELDALARSFPLPVKPEVKTNIQAVSLNLAQGCNLRCTYCFAGEGDYGNKAMMTFETAKKSVEFFSKHQQRFHIVFFGGEPLLNFKVMKELVAWCEAQPTKFTYSITTNGTLLNDDKLQWLKDKNVAVTMSYDGKGLQGKQRRTKDLASSEPLVDKKLEAFKEQLANLRDFRLRATVTKQHLAQFEEAIAHTLNSKNFRVVVSHHASPVKAEAFGPEDAEELAGILHRIVDRCLAEKDYAKLMRIQFISHGIQLIHRGKTGGFACGAGTSYLTVSATGGYYLCHRFNEDESERIGDADRGLDDAQLAEIRKFRGAGTDPCRTCWMREWCAGGCFHEHKAATGSKFDLDPMYCKLQGLELEQAMRVYTILRKEAPHLLDGTAAPEAHKA